MALSSETRRSPRYIGTGSETIFPFAFKLLKPTDLEVRVALSGQVETTLEESAYTVVLNESQDNNPGGTVTLKAPLAKDAALVIISDTPYLQPTTYTNRGGFYPEQLNTNLDRLTILTQQLKEHLDRTITVPPTSPTSPQELFYQLLNAAKEALESAQSAEEALAACEQIRQLIEQYSWDIPHVVDSLRDVEKYPYDGLFAVGGYGNAGGNGQNISNRYVKAENSDEIKVLGQWADDIISNRKKLAKVVFITDFGGVGDGQTNCSAALSAALGISDKVFFPEGTYVLDALPDFSKIEGAGVVKVGTQELPCGEVVSPLTIDYPGQFGTFAAIFGYLSYRRLSALVTINVAAGTYSLTEQITHTHPDGNRIRIIGQGTTESVLKFTLPAASSQAGVWMAGPYEIGLIDSLTLDGNDWAGYSGGTPETAQGSPLDPIGVYSGFSAKVTLGSGCKVYRFARNGLFAAFDGSIVAVNVTVEETGSDAFCATQNGSIRCPGAVAEKNWGVGFFCDYGGVLWASNSTAHATQRRGGTVGGIGYEAMCGGVLYAANSTANETTSHGIDCSHNSIANIDGMSVVNAGRTGALCRAFSCVYANGLTVNGAAVNGVQVQEHSFFLGGNIVATECGSNGAQVAQFGVLSTSGTPSFSNNGAYGIRCAEEGRVYLGGLSIASVCVGNTGGAYLGTLASGNNLENSLIYAAA